MKTYMNKSIAFILSFVLLFGGVFTLMASAEEYVDFRYASEPYDENVIYYDEFSSQEFQEYQQIEKGSNV